MLRNQKGFTLMELMIVIVIIGVLATIGTAYELHRQRAKQTCAANRRTLACLCVVYDGEQWRCARRRVDDLKDYMTNADAVKCPAGNYSIDQDWAVTCDAPGRGTGLVVIAGLLSGKPPPAFCDVTTTWLACFGTLRARRPECW